MKLANCQNSRMKASIFINLSGRKNLCLVIYLLRNIRKFNILEICLQLELTLLRKLRSSEEIIKTAGKSMRFFGEELVIVIY